MARYIDKDKVLNRLRYLCEVASEPPQDSDDIIEWALLQRLEKEFSKIPTADVMEVCWIDINDSLPNNNKSVLCYCKHASTNGETKAIGSYTNGIWFLSDGVGGQSYPRHFWKVTHWMPLPKSPNEKNDFKE